MIIVMRSDATHEQVDAVNAHLESLDLAANISRGAERTLIGAIGDDRKISSEVIETLAGVERVIRILKPYKIVAREWHPQDSIVSVSGIPIGGNMLQVIGGPCSVETPEQMAASASAVRAAGCRLMRGGAFNDHEVMRLREWP